MARELLIEIGCEELPASWLPGLTIQLRELGRSLLQAHRLSPAGSVDAWTTPRRLVVRAQDVPARQPDVEEVLMGPPVSACFAADGTPTPAATGFAAKHGQPVTALERHETPKGTYVAVRRQLTGLPARDVLPQVMAALLRGLAFPKLMRWDATLDDGRGELLFGRPVRWLLFLYDGAAVPFTIQRTTMAQSNAVRPVEAGNHTVGHRVIATVGAPGQPVAVRSFDEYVAALRDRCVLLDREERRVRIAEALDREAAALGGRVSGAVPGDAALLQEVPDLVEWPAVVAGQFPEEFLALPAEVLATTLVHHQHYFPVDGPDGSLTAAFLAVTNLLPDGPHAIGHNAGRVVSARLRDARFFWDADRRSRLDTRDGRLATLVFHKALGSYAQKAARMEQLAGWLAGEALGASPAVAAQAAQAARLAKADLTTDMVREFTELQGVMGGIYARHDGHPEPVWRAIYHHYLPLGVDADAAPTGDALGTAALTWAAVSLADKLDTVVGLFAAGERPTGSRDPFGLRRAAQAIVKVLTDAGPLLGLQSPVDLAPLVAQALAGYDGQVTPRDGGWRAVLDDFFRERQVYLLERRGVRYDEIRAAMPEAGAPLRPADVLARAQALAAARATAGFDALAQLFKRVKNITKAAPRVDALDVAALASLRATLVEPAELALVDALTEAWPVVVEAVGDGRRVDALETLAALHTAVDRFFADVLVMAEAPALRDARLALLGALRHAVLWAGGDISEMAPDEAR